MNDKAETLYDNLTPIRDDGEIVWIVSKADGLRYPTVAVVSEAGQAGGERMTHSDPHRIYPGLNPVSKAWADRVEADAQRQRERGGGVLSQMIDEEFVIVRNLAKKSEATVAEWISMSANIEAIKGLRDDHKHGEAARRHFRAWHSGNDAPENIKRLRHFWAMATGSKRVDRAA